MAISIDQTISKVTYNGVEIPLAGSGGSQPETVTCLSSMCTIYGVFYMSGNDGNKIIAPYGYSTSRAEGAKILKGSHITFPSTLGGFPIYWSPSDALSVVSNAIYYPSGTKDAGYYVCKVIKDFKLLMDD